ncbi:MAG TPA: GNAT family N-acetyltransferase [Anditalea sp.]|nr:GNAT family N-acetyltransferase [Anditalea sp.]
MQLIPIEIDASQNKIFLDEPECKAVLEVFYSHYKKVGFHKPWIAYFVIDDHNNIVGGGGFKGKPKDGKVEISYGTFKFHEGKGVSTEICKQLVILALKTDPTLRVTARTLPKNNASIGVLKRNGFVCLGSIVDEDDGDVLEWELKK